MLESSRGMEARAPGPDVRGGVRIARTGAWDGAICPEAEVAQLATQAAETRPTRRDAARLRAGFGATRHHATKIHEPFSADISA